MAFHRSRGILLPSPAGIPIDEHPFKEHRRAQRRRLSEAFSESVARSGMRPEGVHANQLSGPEALIKIEPATGQKGEGLKMKSRNIPAITIAALLAALGGMALAAQDKYTLQVPNGLAFSDFRGYESWQVVSVAQTEEVHKVIVANPTMIDAYRAGVPDRQAFPRRLQDCEDPVDTEKECGGPLFRECAGHPERRFFHRKG